MKVSNKIWVLLLFLPWFAIEALAQDTEFIPEEGEVVEGEFVISKELEITLPTAQRIFQKVPPDELNERETQPIEYTFREYTPDLQDIPTRLRVLKLKDTRITQAPTSFIKLGFGNYLTPLFQLGILSGVNKQSNIGLNISHLSSFNGPVDKKNSGDSQTNFGVFGKYIGQSASISGDLNFTRLGYHFYGYDDGAEVRKDTIEQNFNDINLGFKIQNAKAEIPFQYSIFGRAYHLSDNYSASEFGFRGGIGGDYSLNETMSAGLKLEYIFAAYKNPESINRSLVRVHPNFKYTGELLTVDAGFRILNYNDTLNNDAKTYLMPVINVGYSLSDEMVAYAELDGNIEEFTLRDIAYENPYVNDQLSVNHTRKPIDLKVGLRGKAIQLLAYDVGVRAAYYKNMYFYINDPGAFNKFTLLYEDGTTSLYQVYASLSLLKNKVLGSTFSMRLNAYDLKNVARPWHKPKFELDYSFWYNIYDKVKLSADIFILSGIQGVDKRVDPQATVKLDPAVDLNFKIDYKLSDKYSAFVSVNNILNRNYELYYRYPTRGLLAIVGFMVSF